MNVHVSPQLIELNLRIIGFSLIFLSLLHGIFYRYFNWQEELKALSPINKDMFLVHCFFVALVLFLMGTVCLFFPGDLTGRCELGALVATGLLIFWGCRLFCQFFVYPAELWRGKKLETAVHIVFSITWTYYVASFGLLLWYQLKGL